MKQHKLFGNGFTVCETISFFGAFSLNKPLVLPVVGKNTLVNKNLAVIIEMVWRPHH
jgi:hypothetical protein